MNIHTCVACHCESGPNRPAGVLATDECQSLRPSSEPTLTTQMRGYKQVPTPSQSLVGDPQAEPGLVRVARRRQRKGSVPGVSDR